MGSSCEESIEWIREFKAPDTSFDAFYLSSDTSPEATPNSSHYEHNGVERLNKKRGTVLSESGEDTPVSKSKKNKNKKYLVPKGDAMDAAEDGSLQEDRKVKPAAPSAHGTSSDALYLSSDTSPEATPNSSNHEHNGVERLNKKRGTVLTESGEDTPVSKSKKTKNQNKKYLVPKGDAMDAAEDGSLQEVKKLKPAAPSVSSRLPLVLPDKVHRTKALVECDGDSIDLSGDVGAVGRIVVSNGSSGKHEILLDLKGTMYKSSIVPSRTFCVVSVGQTEAKIEAIMNDFVRLEPQSNMFEAETMIEGTLDGFSFDSDEEGEKVPKVSVQQSDPNYENKVQPNKRNKGKTEKSVGSIPNKKKASGKAPKKTARRSQVSKRTKKPKK